MIGVYARVSTEEQAKKGFSLKDQIKECRKKAQTDEIMEYVDEGISGEFLDRPALTKLRNDVREGLITKVVCLDPDRLSRKLMNQLIITDELDKKGVDLVFVNGEYAKTPEGNLFYSMRGAIAEFEKAKINERMSRGRREKARQGKVLRDYQIYGYNYDKENAQMVINEDEASVVRLIFDLFIGPNKHVQGINGIAKYLTNRNIPTKRGAKVWHRQVVRQILMQEAYVGTFYQNRWDTEGMLGNKHKPEDERVPMKERPRDEWIEVSCPEIIEHEVFEHAQKLLKESRRRWAKRAKNTYLLSGLLRCDGCGNTMVGVPTTNWGKKILMYIDRKNTAGSKHPGCGRKAKVEEMDNEVWNTIKGWLNNPLEIAAAADQMDLSDSPSFEESEIIRLENEIEKTKAGRKRLLGLFAQGLDISEEEIRDSIRDLKAREEKLLDDLSQLIEVRDQFKDASYNMDLIKNAADYYFQKGEEDLTFEDKQEIIRSVVREIRVFEDGIKIYTF